MKRGLGRAAFVLFLASAAASLSMRGCKEPTQVTVEIRTLGFKCQELRKVTIAVAMDPEAAEKSSGVPQAEVDGRTSCASEDELGTLVITPSGASGAVIVLASYTDAKCVAPAYVGCIVARRRFSFIDNVRLHLPITLEASCKDVPCNALSSCRSGVCVSSETDCSSDGTCATPAEPVVASDGGTVPPPADATLDIPPNDAFVPSDAPADSPPGDGFVPPVDSGPDVVKGTNYGNLCPTMPASDCYLTNDVCCAAAGFSCGDGPTDGSAPTEGGGGDGGPVDGGAQAPTPACFGTGKWYPCTGRLHCGINEFCCYVAGGTGFIPYSACSTPQGNACMSGIVLCNTDDDCPGATRCTEIHNSGAFVPDGGMPMKQCAVP